MAEQTLDQMIDTAFAPISQTLYEYIFFPIIHIAGQDVPFILFWLVSAALFFTFYLGFVNIRYYFIHETPLNHCLAGR